MDRDQAPVLDCDAHAATFVTGVGRSDAQMLRDHMPPSPALALARR